MLEWILLEQNDKEWLLEAKKLLSLPQQSVVMQKKKKDTNSLDFIFLGLKVVRIKYLQHGYLARDIAFFPLLICIHQIKKIM